MNENTKNENDSLSSNLENSTTGGVVEASEVSNEVIESRVIESNESKEEFNEESKIIESNESKASENALINISKNDIKTIENNEITNQVTNEVTEVLGTVANSSKKKLSDYVITLQILKKQEEKTLKFTKRQVMCFGMTALIACTYTVTAFSQYLMNTKLELEENQKALQQVQIEKKHLEATKNTELPPVSDRAIDALAKKATELELKINELESIKTNLNEQIEGVSQTAPEELTEAMASCLTVDKVEADFMPLIKTTYNTDASVLNQLDKVETLLNKTDFAFVSVATEAIETLSAYTDIPSGYPVEDGMFSSGYDYFGRAGRVHKGIDISTNSQKLPVITTAFGVVSESAYHSGYGNYVLIDHGNGYETMYAHNSYNHVEVGDVVHKGDVIATTGSTGMSTGVHCHYEVLFNGEHQNPSDYL